MGRKRIIDDNDQDEWPVRKRGRWKYWVGGLVITLVFLVSFAPNLIAASGLVNSLLPWALSDLNGNAKVGNVSLAWLSPIEISNITVTDQDGNALMSADRVSSDRSLLQLVLSPNHLGTFTVVKPVVKVNCQQQSSNWEQALAKYLNAPSTGATRPGLSVRVVNGSLTLDDQSTNRSWSWEELSLSAEIPADPKADIATEFKAKGSQSGSLEGKITLGTNAIASAILQEFPLEAAEPWLRRMDPQAKAHGRISAQCDLTAKDVANNPTYEAGGDIQASNLEIQLQALDGKSIALHKASLPFAVSGSAHHLQVAHADLQCDVGTARLVGRLPWTLSPSEWLNQTGLDAFVQVDLARLAHAAPNLLRLKEGTSLSEGGVTIRLQSTATDRQSVTWTGSATSQTLVGTANGKTISWNEPISANVTARYRPGRLPEISQLKVVSDVATAELVGKPVGNSNELTLVGTASLDRLAGRLSQFVDLSGIELAGTAEVSASVTIPDAGAVSLNGTATLANFVMGKGSQSLRENNLLAKVQAQTNSSRQGLVAGSASIVAGEDQCQVTLLEPVADVFQPSTGRIRAEIRGDAQRWRKRIDRFIALPQEVIVDGTGTLVGTVVLAYPRINVDDLDGKFTSVRVMGAGVDVIEPQLLVRGMKPGTVAVMDLSTGAMSAENLLIQCATASAVLDQARLVPSSTGPLELNGQLRTNINIGRLQRMFTLQTDPAESHVLAGVIRNGSLNVRTQTGDYLFETTLPMERVSYGKPSAPTWSEPNLMVTAQGRFRPNADELVLKQITLRRPQGFALNASGAVKNVRSTWDVQASGTIDYDLKEFEPQLRQWLGTSVRAVGKGPGQFQLSGRFAGPPTPSNRGAFHVVAHAKNQPSVLRNIDGNAQLSWDLVQAYGFEVGAAKLNARWNDGVIATDPINAVFGNLGRIRVQPRLDVTSPTLEMSLAKGLVIDKAQLTPAACADALGLALPAIAKANQVEGLVSMELDENRIPLVDPTQANIRGKLTLHKVTVSTSPLLSEIARLLGANDSTFTLVDGQVVPVRMEGGRVYHEGMKLTFGRTSVVTTGSVGVDQTLNMVADVPLPASALGSLLKQQPSVAEALRSKRIRVPISGTLAQPRLDARRFQAEIRAVTQEVARDAVGKRVDSEIEKGKKKLGDKLEQGLKKLFK